MPDFIPASELTGRFDVLGQFYSVEVAPDLVVPCRSVLEIVAKGKRLTKPDAIFIMMNPGSSRPLVEVNNRIHADKIETLSVSLVSTKPDTTQYQVMRLMHHCGWRHVRVLNLSDLRCTKSVEFYKRFRRLEREFAFDAHSIFSARRSAELLGKIGTRSVPVVRAWGLSSSLDPLIERCLPHLSGRQTLRGLLKDGTENKFFHPLPSLQSQKLVWVERMVEQCRGVN